MKIFLAARIRKLVCHAAIEAIKTIFSILNLLLMASKIILDLLFVGSNNSVCGFFICNNQNGEDFGLIASILFNEKHYTIIKIENKY